MNIFEAYKAFKLEGELFGYPNNFFIFLKDYFINRLYDEK